jgi:hypothetical protein
VCSAHVHHPTARTASSAFEQSPPDVYSTVQISGMAEGTWRGVQGSKHNIFHKYVSIRVQRRCTQRILGKGEGHQITKVAQKFAFMAFLVVMWPFF